jgi:hypothetical protein
MVISVCTEGGDAAMTRRALGFALVSIFIIGIFACTREEGMDMHVAPDVAERLAVYAPFEMRIPNDLLDERDRETLCELYRAAKVMDEIFLRQVSGDNTALREKIVAAGDGELITFFDLNFGPWDRLRENEPFIGQSEKPLGADFYPLDMTTEEFDAWISAHPEDKKAFEEEFTVIRRTAEGGLEAVPYSLEYAEPLDEAAAHLERAADLSKNESLSNYLNLRAKAFKTDDYFESDMAWMDVEGNLLDVTIGPYEVYEDNLFNYKAAFEAFICVRDPEESLKLDGLKRYLVKMEKNLPIEDRYKNLGRGTASPISVVDLVFSAGDTKAGVQTIAFNLPNDVRVHEAKGSKKVMLRNMCEAKFEKILRPIAEKVLDPELLPLVTFEAYFNHILLHEFSHGLGPGRITLEDGSETTADKALREYHSTVEEAKADVVGQHNFYYLIDEGFYENRLERETAATFLAGFFRSVRFGAESAHGRANMIAFNYLREKGVYRRDESTGRWSVDFERSKGAVRELSRTILMLQALGDYGGSKEFVERYSVMGKDVSASLSQLGDIPIDILPRFAIEKEFDE